MTSAFADPDKYNLYDRKQLEIERKSLATRMAELQGLMNKAQDGFVGPVVAEAFIRMRGFCCPSLSKLWRHVQCLTSR